VRELKHCIDRMAVMHSEGALQISDLPSALIQHLHRSEPGLQRLSGAISASDMPHHTLTPKSPVISIPESEKQTISAALEATNWDRSKAAKLLGTSRTTLYRKIKEYRLGA
jgi:transcriptional regulator of acetoin/glycerol metabolism